MQLTKFTHACVRLVVDGTTLVIDPGVWTEPEALDGADAILVTHEHADHFDASRLAGLEIPVYGPAGADLEGVDVVPVAVGETFTAAGVRVQAFGERHAVTFAGKPGCANFGYFVDGRLYHPGDALARPGLPIETLLVPIAGPWVRTDAILDFAIEVAASRTIGIHDGTLNERGVDIVNGWLSREVGPSYRWLRPGASA